MVADWLFVVGISLEISGAALVGGEVLFASRKEIAARGIIYPTSGVPLRDSQRGPAFTYAGFTLIGLGFVVQLFGYVVAAGNDWFFLVAAVAIAASFAVGWWMASRAILDWLHRRAISAYRAQQGIDSVQD